MKLLTTEILVFMITIFDGVQSELDPFGLNVCRTQKTYEERTPVTKQKPREVKKKKWCWDIRKLFSCKKTVIVWETHVEYVTRPRTRIVSECCAGYIEKGNKCVPHCKDGCLFGNCEAPDVCACLAGFYGPGCYQPCNTGFWGENCTNECKCSNDGVCHKKFGCECGIGWTGLRCELPCQDGFYGYLCKEECKCDGANCNHITGECIKSTEPATPKFTPTTETEVLPPFITTGVEFSTEEISTQTLSTAYFNTSTEVHASTESSTTVEISMTEIFKLSNSVNPNSTSVAKISTTTEKMATTTDETDATSYDMVSLKEKDFSEGNDALASSGETVSTKPPLSFTKQGTSVGEITTVRISSEKAEREMKINVVEKELHFNGESGSTNTPEQVTIINSTSISETVNEFDIIEKKTSWIELTASNDGRDKDETDNFILETNGNSKSKETIFKSLHFLPSLSVISAVSFLILIIAARWLIVTHRRKTRMLVMVADKGNIFQSEEPVKFQAESIFWVNNCTVNPIYMSEVDLNNATPVLETFKPVDKGLTLQDRTIL